LTIVRGDPAVIRVDLTGVPPWSVKWRDVGQSISVSSTPYFRDISPSPTSTTTYWIDAVTASGCSATLNASGTVHVLPPPPAAVVATTREDNTRVVDISWTAVSGATGYLIERATIVDGAATFSTIVGAGSTSYPDTVPATTNPVTYIYYVRTLNGETSLRGPFDFATGATALYGRTTITAGMTVLTGDVAELRRGIDALRAAFGLPPAFASASGPTGLILATHFTALATARNEVRPFVYTAPPFVGGPIRAAHITELRTALR
jgi:hypothetical protein